MTEVAGVGDRGRRRKLYARCADSIVLRSHGRIGMRTLEIQRRVRSISTHKIERIEAARDNSSESHREGNSPRLFEP